MHATLDFTPLAMERFVYQPVNRPMVRYLAQAAANVISCDPNVMPIPASSSKHGAAAETATHRAVTPEDSPLPSLEEFITTLVLKSNVQVSTLMSTLVYLNRLKNRLMPMSCGLRCTGHRVFLASLILTAKYLNDSSPKNMHWSDFSYIQDGGYDFGFSQIEVNLMEKQLLNLLEWDLRITQDDLHHELEPFLAPIRADLEARHEQRMARKRAYHEEKLRQEAERQRKEKELRFQQQQMIAQAVARFPTPPNGTSDGHAGYYHKEVSLAHRQSQGGLLPATYTAPCMVASCSSGGSSSTSASSPPGLYYSGSVSYASSEDLQSRDISRSTTPLDVTSNNISPQSLVCCPEAASAAPHHQQHLHAPQQQQQQQQQKQHHVSIASNTAPYYASPSHSDDAHMLAVEQAQVRASSSRKSVAYELNADDVQALNRMSRTTRRARGMIGRVFGSGPVVA